MWSELWREEKGNMSSLGVMKRVLRRQKLQINIVVAYLQNGSIFVFEVTSNEGT